MRLAFALAILATGCAGADKDADGTGPVSTDIEDIPVSIAFEGRFDEHVFQCGQEYAYQGLERVGARPLDFRLYVHDVGLVDTEGTTWPVALDPGAFQGNGVALVDFSNGANPCTDPTDATHTTVTGIIGDRDYVGLRFKVGVPFELNHVDIATATAPLDDTTLYVGEQEGYIFLRMDMSPVGAQPFPVQIHSSGCTLGAGAMVESCSSPNVLQIGLEGFDPAVHKVVVDGQALLSTAEITRNTGGTPAGCTSVPSDPDCSPIFVQYGLGALPQQFIDYE